MENETAFLIDIERILKQKAGTKASFVPKFVVSYLKRIIHQDEVNDILTRTADKKGVPFLEACMKELDVKIEVEGKENLPTEGLCTFVSNHPLGGLDGISLGWLLGTHYDGRIKYIVNDLLMNLHGLAPLCIPVNKTGGQSRALPQMIEEGFRSDNHIIMFPAGICSRKINGVIQDIKWQKVFVTKSIETGRTIVPIHFGGRNSDFFYNLANICSKLHIKFNVAMLYLADELFKNKHKTFTVKIGKPIPASAFDDSKSATEWAAHVRDLVYKL